jgi:hypothetical protein
VRGSGVCGSSLLGIERTLRPQNHDPKTLGADLWRARAQEARKLADLMSDESSKQKMLEIAISYEKLVNQAEASGEMPVQTAV